MPRSFHVSLDGKGAGRHSQGALLPVALAAGRLGRHTLKSPPPEVVVAGAIVRYLSIIGRSVRARLSSASGPPPLTARRNR